MNKEQSQLSSGELANTLQAIQHKFTPSIIKQTEIYRKPFPIRFSHTPVSLNKETSEIEKALLDYIKNKTNYFANQTLEEERRKERILKFYIELYVHNPDKYPLLAEHPIHSVIHQAGDYVLNSPKVQKIKNN